MLKQLLNALDSCLIIQNLRLILDSLFTLINHSQSGHLLHLVLVLLHFFHIVYLASSFCFLSLRFCVRPPPPPAAEDFVAQTFICGTCGDELTSNQQVSELGLDNRIA